MKKKIIVFGLFVLSLSPIRFSNYNIYASNLFQADQRLIANQFKESPQLTELQNMENSLAWRRVKRFSPNLLTLGFAGLTGLVLATDHGPDQEAKLLSVYYGLWFGLTTATFAASTMPIAIGHLRTPENSSEWTMIYGDPTLSITERENLSYQLMEDASVTMKRWRRIGAYGSGIGALGWGGLGVATLVSSNNPATAVIPFLIGGLLGGYGAYQYYIETEEEKVFKRIQSHRQTSHLLIDNRRVDVHPNFSVIKNSDEALEYIVGVNVLF